VIPGAAIETIADSDGALATILGIAVMLVFAGVVVRAILRRTCPSLRSRRDRRPVPEQAPAAPEPTPAEQPKAAHSSEGEKPRLAPETIEPFAQTVEYTRRLRAAEARVNAELHALPSDAWFIEQYVLVDAHRVPFVVAGSTGVFVLCATDGGWGPSDLYVLSGLAGTVQEQLPGYDGRVEVVMCLAFDEMKPRAWYGGERYKGRGGWVLGIDSLLDWLLNFDTGDGLSRADVHRLQQAAGPFWDRRSTARLPTTPNFG
jgi:hypothetical protein